MLHELASYFDVTEFVGAKAPRPADIVFNSLRSRGGGKEVRD